MKILNFSQKQVNDMVTMAKNGVPTIKIAENYKSSFFLIKKILKQQLKEEYNNYCSYYHPFSPNQIKQIVNLRTKRRYKLKEIAEELQTSVGPIITVLKRELKDKYESFRCPKRTPSEKHCEIIPICCDEIILLYCDDKSVEEIEKITGVPLRTIRKLLTFDVIFNKIVVKLQNPQFLVLKDECHLVYREIYTQIANYIYLTPLNSAPPVIFLFLRKKAMNIGLKDFIEALNIPRRQFLTQLKYILKNFQVYFRKDNKTIVLRIITNLEQQFNFDITFHEEALRLLNQFWALIKNTKEKIIASVICILTMVKLNISAPKYKAICDNAGVLMSSVLYQIKHNIMEKFGIREFQGLTKSPHILNEVLNVTGAMVNTKVRIILEENKHITSS